MHYTKLSVAGCAALMFGLLACSGEDGRDGINGTNGLNGADGTSCVVKSLNDASGYKILCGGDSVGVLLNGKTGNDWCESTSVSPCPGKCFAQAKIPASCIPRIYVLPYEATFSLSEPNERALMTGLSGLTLMSTSGAKLI